MVVSFGQSESNRRLGWLLRTSRGSLGLREFAATLGGGIAPSTLSRWERGSAGIGHFAVRGYANALDRPELVTIADNMARYYGNRLGPGPALARPPLDPASVSTRLDRLIERATGDDLFSGRDWDALTDLLSRGLVVVSPRSTWARLAERLLAEMAIADGAHWLWRAEALHRLLAHPVGGEIAVATAAAAAADRATQSLIGTISVLDATSSGPAASVVMRQLTNPTSHRSFSGALLSCHRKVRLGHFTRGQLVHIGGVLAELRDQPLAAAIAACLPAQLRKRFGLITKTDRDGARDHRTLIETVTASVGGTVHPADQDVLNDLLAEALAADVFDERMHALFLLHAGPCRVPIARELGRIMAGRHREPESAIVAEALRKLGGRRERALVEQLVLAAGTRADVREAAAFALGHIGGESDENFWRAALAITRRWRPGSTTTSTIDRLVYAAGRTEKRNFLHWVLATADLPRVARVSARWWLEIPSHIRLSVTV
ncbi:hypothetical protein [Amycolatopsis sp. NPDC049159]|uniref:hypothetical protein n=1 Tax=Amycolatopsis sp. NPDC049159 TaxID=3157210 RepID=UPI0033F85119